MAAVITEQTQPLPQPLPQSQPQALPQAQAPLPEPEEASAAQMDNDPSVQSAVRFLQDPRVKNSPIESQIRFLKGKSMSDSQIKHAFSKVGRAVTAEKVASVRAPPPMNASLTSAPSSMPGNTSPLTTQLKSRPLSPVGVVPQQPQYTQTLFPRTPPPPQEEAQPKGVDWRDVVIGTGAALLAGFAGYKLFNRYSPYEIRRKSDKKASRAYRGPGGRARPAIRNGSSEDETDGSSAYQQGRVPPLPPPPPQPAAGAVLAGEPAAVATPAANAEELKKTQTDLEETKEALTNERKKCADLAVSSAKIRAEKQQLSRANDRLTQQVDTLKKSLEKLEEEKEKAAATSDGTLTATEEEPARPYYPSLTVEGEQARQSPVVPTPTTVTAPALMPNATIASPSPVVAPAAATAAAVLPSATTALETTLAPLATLQSTPDPTPAPVVEVAEAAEVVPLGLPAAPAPSVPLPTVAADDVAVATSVAAATIPPAFLTPDSIKTAEDLAAAAAATTVS